MQKAKKEDFRVEEELRTQKVKYEEASDEVVRRMEDIRDAEGEGVVEMAAFLDAQLKYHEESMQVLLQLKQDWPGQGSPRTPNGRRAGRGRANTAQSYYEPPQEEYVNGTDSRPIIRSNKPVLAESPVRDPYYAADTEVQRPVYSRTPTFEGPTQLRPDPYANNPVQTRTTSENLSTRISQLRPVSRVPSDSYADHYDNYSHTSSSPDRMYGNRSVSPTPSYGHSIYRENSSGNLNSSSVALNGLSKKAPPPPPSRAKKPPPPPPPMKRPIVAGE